MKKQKLSIVIPIINNFKMTDTVVEYLKKNSVTNPEILIIDNNSDEEYENKDVSQVLRNPKNIGVYPAFKQGLEYSGGDIICFMHNDVFIHELGWDKRVLEAFDKNRMLGMISFVGSSQIDYFGGRGNGTMSNFQGKTIDIAGEKITTSPAESHGIRITDLRPAVVVDGCVMIIRRSALEEIGFRENFAIHHFYDKLISVQLIEKRWNVAVLGIEMDHVSGRTVDHEIKYHLAAKDWSVNHRITPGGIGTNWDTVIYKEAERQFLKEYRDEKYIVPISIGADWRSYR